MTKRERVCGVLLCEEAYGAIGEALKPYTRKGPIGNYLYCNSAQQNGHFLDMTFAPEMCDGSVKDEMLVSIPLTFVRLIVSAVDRLPIGFSQHE